MTYHDNQPSPNRARNPGKRLLALLARWWDEGPWQKVAIVAALGLLLVCAGSSVSLLITAGRQVRQFAREAAATGTAQAASTVRAGAPTDTPSSSSHVIFSDDFSGNSLSSAWTIIKRHGEYAQDETECNVPEGVSVDNHLLTITTTAKSATCGDFNLDGSERHSPTEWPYTTGAVQWKSLAFTYGTVTYRAKFPPQDTGTWPAIWLMGSNCQATNVVMSDSARYASCPALQAPGYVEMDMTECFSDTWCQLALAQPSSWPTCDYPVDSDWHTFTFEWTPSAISVSMDGRTTACGFSAADGYIIPSTPMFLLIQTQTGGIGGTPNDSNLPALLQVSNVTVSQP
jgi:beta-glucanase (GH16 family)